MPDIKLTYDSYDYDSEIAIEGGSLNMSTSVVGDMLSADSMRVSVIGGGKIIRVIADDQNENGFLLTDDNYIICIGDDFVPPVKKENEPGTLYVDNVAFAKQYIDKIERRTKYHYDMSFYSSIWILEQSDHVGGIYDGETVGEVVADIIGDTVPYIIDADIAAAHVYGWLPYQKRRENLQMLRMAIGAAIKSRPDGTLHITSYSDNVAGVFDTSRIILGGTLVDRTSCTAVQVTEHEFIEDTETISYTEESTMETKTLIFQEPLHDLDITNATIVDSGVNYCTYTGDGGGDIVITGKRYKHITRIITYGKPPTGDPSDVVRRVDNNTLLGPLNALIVAQRIYDFFSAKKSIKQEVIISNERPGDVVLVTNPYSKELETATLIDMSVRLGGKNIIAMCEFVLDYLPPPPFTGFTHYTILTGSGTFTPEEGVTIFRAILIGAGNGGTGGRGGQAAIASTSNGGIGGTGGAKGLGGKVFAVTLAAGTYSFCCGAGGKGGAGGAGGTTTGEMGTLGATGEVGEDTTFGSYTSGIGSRYPDGYYEPISGLTVAVDGINGADAGNGLSFISSHTPFPISNSITWQGNTWYSGVFYRATSDSPAPGGPAVGSNGGDDVTGTPPSGPDDGYRAGNGANATAADSATQYGGGGNGGHGGGGGGGRWLATYGYGGNGSDGGDGADGAIIIVW